MNRGALVRHNLNDRSDRQAERQEPDMSNGGFTDEGLTALDAALARHEWRLAESNPQV